MEAKFQTSFIPKKMPSPIGISVGAPKNHAGTSILMIVGVLSFIISILAAGGSYGWNRYLLVQQDKYRIQLIERRKQYESSLTDLEKVKAINVKIDAASLLLSKHVALSQIFAIISQLTTENVRFLNLDLTMPGEQVNDGVKISMHGYGTSLAAIAWQSDVLSHLDQYDLRQVVKNPILSDPSLDTNSTVAFGFTATIDPTKLLYSNGFKKVETDLEPKAKP